MPGLESSAENLVIIPEPILPEGKKKRRRRRRRKGKGSKQKQNNATDDVAQGRPDSPRGEKTKKKKPKGRRGIDRYFGFFHCKPCKHLWGSAHVYTKAGTSHVLWRQACQTCHSWLFPFRLDLILCSVCGKKACECLCDDCGKLKHKPPDPQDPTTENVEYCDCKKHKKLKRKDDSGKPHRADLCERCIQGLKCNRSRPSEE